MCGDVDVCVWMQMYMCGCGRLCEDVDVCVWMLMCAYGCVDVGVNPYYWVG